MPRQIRALSFLLCDRIEVDLATGRDSLLGVFRSLRAAGETAETEFSVYAEVENAAGTHAIELLVTRTDTEEDLLRDSWTGTVPANKRVAVFKASARCTFPNPGHYLVTLLLGGEIVAGRLLTIRPP